MTDGDALLKAILARPDDDTARLVYADWLDENGRGPEARFIRYQCSGRAHVPPLTMLVGLEVVLGVQPHQTRLVGSMTGHATAQAPGVVLTFRRGFLDELALSADSWVLHADALLAAHPVTRVTLKTVPVVDSDGVHVRVRGRARWYFLDALPSTRSDPDNFYTALLKMEWPGVAFDLPDRVRLQPDGPGSYRFG